MDIIMKKRFLSSVLVFIIAVSATLSGCNFTDNTQPALETVTQEAKTQAPSTVKQTSKPADTAKPTEKATVAEKKTEPATETETDKPTEKATTEAAVKPDAEKNLVVVLDAGHDETKHTRNHPNLGVNEQDLNLKICKWAYKRLSKYNGVKVYMSRPDGECPIQKYNCSYVNKYPEPCIRARTDFAEDKKADIFISFHCNASSGNLGASANGAEVYISKYPEFYSKYKKLGEIILNSISSKVDVRPNGVRTRSKPEKGTYDDGTVKDYYYLLSNNVDNGRPAAIIEHAYMDNTHDNAVLRDDANLKKLGIADADAIARFYGLTLK